MFLFVDHINQRRYVSRLRVEVWPACAKATSKVSTKQRDDELDGLPNVGPQATTKKVGAKVGEIGVKIHSVVRSTSSGKRVHVDIEACLVDVQFGTRFHLSDSV